VNDQQLQKMASGKGFIAALDQSGGSTPKALRLYGIPEDAYANEDEMFELIHAMRSRIIESPSFGGDRILGAILFEGTMDRQIGGEDTASYLWNKKNVVPFLKVDKGLQEEADGVQLMKPIPGLDELLSRALDKGIFGTKMRSFALRGEPDGIKRLIDQQFELADQILRAGLVPIIEPEVDIHSPSKSEAEELLKAAVVDHLGRLSEDLQVILKLTLPSTDDFYLDLVNHPRVLRVVALSGGYTRDEANELLARNHGLVASFSRALTEGLSVDQSDDRFDMALDASIGSIYRASTSKLD
jgi:fructose-bisphosphate aldolase, class I